MFGSHHDDSTQDDQHAGASATITEDGTLGIPAPAGGDTVMPSSPSDDANLPALPQSFRQSATDAPASDTSPMTPSDDVTPVTTADSNSQDLIGIKQAALQQLKPLVGHLDQTPEEKFRTTMMMIQAADDQSLINDAYEAAKMIADEKVRAQALLDVVNEINYFTSQQTQA